ncbi:uncharacterized protein RSE6_05896 [Rhynchosporium secalis]|uniref:Uncharacterized protein n=1 Tax=Rhynchosporium secalis TaxID=38038 RepID=A0A1E1M910_RHYSE|nr:uncharacterized protein RSE6_05896 [Rhynchosporium secalis]
MNHEYKQVYLLVNFCPLLHCNSMCYLVLVRTEKMLARLSTSAIVNTTMPYYCPKSNHTSY